MSWLFWAVILLIAVWLIWTYNGLVALRHQIENAWKQIDVQLKRAGYLAKGYRCAKQSHGLDRNQRKR